MNKPTSISVRIVLMTLVLAGGSLSSLMLGSHIPTLSAKEPGRPCSIESLEGDWGVSVSGTRVAGPGVTEAFIGVALRTYDGRGGFIEVANSHGQVSGVSAPTIAGTYNVGPDCTGTARFTPSGAPVVIESAFVIVDKGNEIREVVLRPLPNLVTAVQRRVH
jgi:hypothetical protein